MLAEQSLREGKLDEALSQLQDAIRKDPANAEYRVFLFQLLSILGQWDRALNQLNVCGEMDASTLAMVQTYREALQCEVLRGEVFAGKRSPLVFGEPEPWIAWLMQAQALTAQGDHDQAAELRNKAFEAAPATSGSIQAGEETQPFSWIADADLRIGPILEVIVNGKYYWAPFHRIQKVTLEAPADLRDEVWTFAQFTWANGGEAVGLIPTRYAGSQSHEDPSIRRAKKTEWTEPHPEVYLGLGQRMLTTDAGDFALLDIRTITLDVAEEASSEEADAGNSNQEASA